MDIIATLISILGMLGLTELQTVIKEKHARIEGVSEDDIIKAINVINNNTRSANDKTLSKVISQLNSVTFPAGMSENTKQYIYSVRNQLNKKQNSLSNKINEIERNVNSIDERARVYMGLDPNTRIATKQTLVNLINDAAEQNKQAGGNAQNYESSDLSKQIEDPMNNGNKVVNNLKQLPNFKLKSWRIK